MRRPRLGELGLDEETDVISVMSERGVLEPLTMFVRLNLRRDFFGVDARGVDEFDVCCCCCCWCLCLRSL